MRVPRVRRHASSPEASLISSLSMPSRTRTARTHAGDGPAVRFPPGLVNVLSGRARLAREGHVADAPEHVEERIGTMTARMWRSRRSHRTDVRLRLPVDTHAVTPALPVRLWKQDRFAFVCRTP